WAPVGAEKLSSGYELAMKSGSGQFIIWTLDNNGNYVTNAAPVSGTSTTLESYETSFQQDLNGDGVIGVPAASSAANSSFVFTPAVGKESGAGTVHSTSLADLGQKALSAVHSLVDLVSGSEQVDPGHTNFEFVDSMDHFIIR